MHSRQPNPVTEPNEQLENSVRIHWTCDSPTPYNDYLFEAIERTKWSSLLVHYRRNVVSSHPWKALPRAHYESRVQKRFPGVDWLLLRTVIKDHSSIYVLGGWSDSTSILLAALCMLLKRTYFIWTDTPNLEKQRPWARAALRRAFLRALFHRSHAILGTGRPAVEALSTMEAPQEKLIIFPFWVDVDKYRSARRTVATRPQGRITLVSSGSIVNALKGHDCALRGLAKALARAPGTDVAYLIAGSGPDSDLLKQLISDLRLSKYVTMLGWLEHDEVVDLLGGADVLIHPSPVHEPYGVAVIEAMAAGMVVLASDATGAAIDRIKHGFNGFIHRAGDVDMLADQLLWVFNNPGKLTAIGQNARATADEWRISRAVTTLEQLCYDIG